MRPHLAPMLAVLALAMVASTASATITDYTIASDESYCSCDVDMNLGVSGTSFSMAAFINPPGGQVFVSSTEVSGKLRFTINFGIPRTGGTLRLIWSGKSNINNDALEIRDVSMKRCSGGSNTKGGGNGGPGGGWPDIWITNNYNPPIGSASMYIGDVQVAYVTSPVNFDSAFVDFASIAAIRRDTLNVGIPSLPAAAVGAFGVARTLAAIEVPGGGQECWGLVGGTTIPSPPSGAVAAVWYFQIDTTASLNSVNRMSSIVQLGVPTSVPSAGPVGWILVIASLMIGGGIALSRSRGKVGAPTV